jgi:hypothetical protein
MKRTQFQHLKPLAAALTIPLLALILLLAGHAHQSAGASPPVTPGAAGLQRLQIDPARLAAPAAIAATALITARADAELVQGYPTSTCGSELDMRVGYDTYLDPDGLILRSLLHFDLGAIPPGARVQNATLWLYLTGSYDVEGYSMRVTPYRVTAPWVAETVAWQDGITSGEPYTWTWIPYGFGSWHPFDVSALVRGWVDGTFPNYGLMLRGPESAPAWRSFATHETIAPPYLDVQYAYTPSPAYALTLVPARQAATAGQGAAWDLYVSARDGFSETVTLDVTGLPPATTHGWAGNPLPANAVTRLALATTPDTPAGTYTLTVTGAAGGLQRQVQALLAVSNPDFSLALDPQQPATTPGGTARYTVLLSATAGFTPSVSLAAGGLPTGTTVVWSANPVSPIASSTLTSTLALTTALTTPPGTYTFTVTGTGGSRVHTAQAALEVLEPDFSLDLSPAGRAIAAGGGVTYHVALSAPLSFVRAVPLAAGGLPTGTAHAWSANPVPPPAGSTLTSTLALTTALATPPGTYTLTITGTAGGHVHTARATLEVQEPDFDLGLSPAWHSVFPGGDVGYSVLLSAPAGFTPTVALAASGLPTGTTAAWSANPAGTTAGSVLTLTTVPTTPPGIYTFTVTGTAATRVHTASAVLEVAPDDFTLDLWPGRRAVVPGAGARYTVTLDAAPGYTRTVALDLAGLPAGTAHAWSANPVAPPATARLALTTTTGTLPGTYTLVVTGTGGSRVHAQPALLEVRAAAPEPITSTIYLPLLRRPPLRRSSPGGSSAPAAASRVALIVGIADYEHMDPASGLRAGAPGNDLGYTTYDAYDTQDTLLTAGTFQEADTTLFLDEQATKAAIHAAIVNWIDPREDAGTLVVIFFSGHGMFAPDDDGDESDGWDEFLVPYEIDWDAVAGQWKPEMAIRDDELAAWLSVLESQQVVVIVDSCFSGGLIESLAAPPRGLAWRPADGDGASFSAAGWRDGLVQDVQAPGRVILTASAEGQPSTEFGALQNGAFSYYLLQALRTPAADTDLNGWVSVQEAYAYLAPRVDAYVYPRTGEHQNPQLDDGVGTPVDLAQLPPEISPCVWPPPLPAALWPAGDGLSALQVDAPAPVD